MARRDQDRLELARRVQKRFADPAILSPIQARSFVRCLQTTWNVDQIQWSAEDSTHQVADAQKLLHAGLVLDEFGGPEEPDSVHTFKRAGELFEWLDRSDDVLRGRTALALLAAGCYQLAGLPAMAAGLLQSAKLSEPGQELFASFLAGDFDKTLQLTARFWTAHAEEIRSAEGSGLSYQDDALSWRFTVETVRALGLFCASLRRGSWERNALALKKLEALSLHGTRVLTAELSLLLLLITRISRRFEAASIYHPLLLLSADRDAETQLVRRYARRLYGRRRGTLWASQKRGLDKLTESSTFALCTPTGSGKTLIANIAILKSLLLDARPDETSRLALYIVPSRALAAEVEAKLSSELRDEIIVTGLYGGNDWGITDYWLNAEQPAVLIATVEKAEALFRNIGSLILPQLGLLILDEAHQVVLDTSEKAAKRFARHTDRSLRLEGFITRILARKPNIGRIALTAVAGGAATPVSCWMEGNSNASPVGLDYRSTRQVIGMLETSLNANPRFKLDLVNGVPIEVRGRGDSPYIKLRFGPVPHVPASMRSSLDRFNQLTVLWTALNLRSADQRVLISIAQQPERSMGWFVDALDLETWAEIDDYTPPDNARSLGLYKETLAACEDYCGDDSFERRLLKSGVASSHGQMPQRLRRLMNQLIEEGICPITVATATLTEGVNLPFDIILVPSIKRPVFDPVTRKTDVHSMTPSEFLNLSGRAGRPGVSRAGEGMTFVAVPQTVATTAPRQIPNQRRQCASLKQEYDRLLEALVADATAQLPRDDGPLASLVKALFEKASTSLGVDDPNAFLGWLETATPADISDEAGQESEDARALLADTLDELDAILLAATEDVARLDDVDLSPQDVENSLRTIWQTSFSAFAQTQEAWLESAFVKRGTALTETVYPDAIERRRLYAYGLTPHIGRQFELVSADILERLQDAENYGADDEATRMNLFHEIGAFLIDHKGFGFSVRPTQTDANILENWQNVLAWWFAIDGATPPEPKYLRAWQRFVNSNLEFRLGVAVGAVVSRAWTEGAGDELVTPTLETWKETTGLPWVAFWTRELLRWGTHDPFIAFCLAQGITKTRRAAAAEKGKYLDWISDQIDRNPDDAESKIDPQNFLAWRKEVDEETKEKRVVFRLDAVLLDDRLRNQRYDVLPISHEDKVEWIDPAGYLLAVTSLPEQAMGPINTQSDYRLVVKDKDAPYVRRLFAKGR